MKFFMSVLLLLTLARQIRGESVGSIATINTYDGAHLGPYIVKDFHTHAEPAAEALVDEEGSGAEIYVDSDTESGDDDPSGGLPTLISENGSHKHVDPNSIPSADARNVSDSNTEPNENSGKAEPAKFAAISVQDAKIDSGNSTPISSPSAPKVTPEVTTIRQTTPKRTSTTASPTTSTSITTTRSSTPAPTQKSTTKAPVTQPPQPPVTPENSTCHSSCQELLHRTSLTVTPNVNYIQEASTIAFTCQVHARNESGVSQKSFLQNLAMHWVFEGGNPPQSACAVVDQPYLATCEGFASTRVLTESNATFLGSNLVVNDLAAHNTGYYKCQVSVECCSNLLQHELSRYVTVWEVDYTVHLAVMGGITAAVLIMLLAGLFFKRKAEAKSSAYNSVAKAERKRVDSHEPFLVSPEIEDDPDSFSSNDDY